MTSSPSSQRFAEAPIKGARPLHPWPQVLREFADVVRQVEALHQAGRLHGAIGIEALGKDDEGRWVLAAPRETITLGGEYWDPARCPPGIQADHLVILPTRLGDAAAALATDVPGADPRWIDFYQLGGLLYELLCGRSLLEYLYTARGKSRVPRPVRPILEGLLGFDPACRFASCAAALSAIETALDTQTQATAPEESDRPQRLGPYRLLEYIGRGGMGEVYRGYEEALDREVAVKVLPRELADRPEFVERFRSEAVAAAQVAHPNVVPIYSVGREAGRHYFAMQFVVGESLAERLRRRGRLPLAEALDLGAQILGGLAAAHARGVIHRDLKPGNILIEQGTNRVLLADFGLSRRLTATGQCVDQDLFLGTVEYLAPEQIRGEPADVRSDLYAFGAMLYQMVSGRGPRRAETPTGALLEGAFGGPLGLDLAKDDLPGELRRLMDRLTARRPEDRYASCAEALAELKAIRTTLPDKAAQPSNKMTPAREQRRWLRRRWIAAALLVAAGLGCVAWVTLHTGCPKGFLGRALQAESLLPPVLPADQWIDLLGQVVPERDSVAGAWDWQAGAVRALGEPFSRLLLPVCVNGGYALEVEFTRYSAGDVQGNVEVFLPVGTTTCAVSLSGSSEVPGQPDRVHGLSRVRGYTPGEASGGANPTARFPGTLENDRPHRLAIEVRPEGESQVRIQAHLDGQGVVDWSGPPDHLDLHPSWRLPEPLRPGLGAASNPVAFTAVRFRLFSGVAWAPAPGARQAPHVVQPGADRAIVLSAPAAEIHGHVLRETAPGVLGFWSDEREWVSWSFLAAPHARYRLELRYACHEPAAGSTYTVTVRGPRGTQIVGRGTVASTGHYWDNFRTVPLGTWRSAESGPYTLELKPAVKPGEAVMNLQWIRLVPMESEPAASSAGAPPGSEGSPTASGQM